MKMRVYIEGEGDSSRKVMRQLYRFNWGRVGFVDIHVKAFNEWALSGKYELSGRYVRVSRRPYCGVQLEGRELCGYWFEEFCLGVDVDSWSHDLLDLYSRVFILYGVPYPEEYSIGQLARSTVKSWWLAGIVGSGDYHWIFDWGQIVAAEFGDPVIAGWVFGADAALWHVLDEEMLVRVKDSDWVPYGSVLWDGMRFEEYMLWFVTMWFGRLLVSRRVPMIVREVHGGPGLDRVMGHWEDVMSRSSWWHLADESEWGGYVMPADSRVDSRKPLGDIEFCSPEPSSLKFWLTDEDIVVVNVGADDVVRQEGDSF